MKFCVGLLLTTFGTFWAGEGVRVEWPGGDVALLWILVLFTAGSLGLVRLFRSRHAATIGRLQLADAETH
jgi:uncharacterized membrane protein